MKGFNEVTAGNGAVLLDRAQRGNRVWCGTNAVEADNGDIFWDDATAFVKRLHRSHSKSIRCREDGVERDIVVYEIQCCSISLKLAGARQTACASKTGRRCSFMALM